MLEVGQIMIKIQIYWSVHVVTVILIRYFNQYNRSAKTGNTDIEQSLLGCFTIFHKTIIFYLYQFCTSLHNILMHHSIAVKITEIKQPPINELCNITEWRAIIYDQSGTREVEVTVLHRNRFRQWVRLMTKTKELLITNIWDKCEI